MPVVIDGTTGITDADGGTVLSTADIASQAQAEAGTDNTTVMTPLRTEQHTLASDLGWGQTWQDVIGSRANGTSYQNTTGRPILVSISATSGTAGTVTMFQVSPDNTTWVTAASRSDTAINNASVVVPNTWYYRLQNCTTIATWAELR